MSENLPSGPGAPAVGTWREQARAWLRAHAQPVDPIRADGPVEAGSVAVFENLTFEQERNRLAKAARWQQAMLAAGYCTITWPPEYGAGLGAGLSAEHEDAFLRREAMVRTPRGNELFSVTVDLSAPTIAEFGTDAQRRELIPKLLAAEIFACQLRSEPGAGSDLAALSLRAERQGDDWLLNGQKMWTSGARHAAVGELIARSEPGSLRHHGLTAFLVPMDAPGVEIRPIRQMSGGSSFNEVFFTDVTVPDSCRLGAVGQRMAGAVGMPGAEGSVLKLLWSAKT
jgi:alkylation response protein AidB-like acyl-CoA dehydrogenase